MRSAERYTSGGDTDRPRAEPRRGEGSASRPDRPMEAYGPARQGDGGAAMLMLVPGGVARPGDVVALAPNVLSVRHWDRLMGGALYAATTRVDWARLLRRSFEVDVLECPRC